MNKVKTMLVVALGLATLGVFPSQAQARGIYGSINTQAVVMNNFATRQAQLRSQIAADVSNGTLSPMVANSLTSELDSINAQEQSAMAFGSLNNFQISQMTNLFNDVSSKLDAAVASNPFGGNPYGMVPAVSYNYAAPVAPMYVRPFSTTPVWRDVRHDMRNLAVRPIERDIRDMNREMRRDMRRDINRNWQFDRRFDRQTFAANHFDRERVANLPHDNERFDGHRR